MKRNFSGTPDEARIAQLVARGEYAQLEPVARRLLSRTPDHPLGLKALAVAHITAGRQDEGLPLLRRGVSLYPGDPEMHSNLAIALATTGHHRESLANIEQALALAPERAEFHANRAAALLHLGALDAAIDSCRAALRLNPQQADAHNTLGAALHRKRQFAEALEAFQAAVRNNPESIDAFMNFVVTLGDLGRYGEAAACARKVLEEGELSQQETDVLLPHLCAAERACCDWHRVDLPAALRDTIRRRVEPGPEPFFVTHIEDIDRATLRQGAETYGRAALRAADADPGQMCSPGVAASGALGRPLRIGFLSADFRAHPVSELAVGIYENLDRKEFAVHAYGYGPQDASPVRRRLDAAFNVFRDIDALSYAAAADLMRRDGIDILIDMNGWTKFSRSGILAHAPAPVTATWLGFPGTLGVPGLAHYLISDAVVTPLDHAGDYAEHLALMPHSYQPSSRVVHVQAAPTRQEAGLPEDAFVFCSFNQSVKITPAAFGLWCELLRRNPAAILWLGFQSDAAQANLRREAQARGIDAARILFAPWRELPEHLARLPLADLALDSFPYGSHTTGSDMLWAGVPMVARLDDTFAGRVSASVLQAAGLPELIVRSDQDYLALADDLAGNPERCRALRQKLDVARATVPLFDTRRFSRDLGRLFRAMWQNHIGGRHAAIDLSPCDE
jgi:predicted O-linked N-acetylglucosamine transferase (SPINDLY family)